jgi:hypothetical protein
VVVLVTVLICSVFFGAFDAIWLWLTNLMLGVTGNGLDAGAAGS